MDELTTPQLIATLWKGGLRTVTPRKLLRWASPVITTRDSNGATRKLGALPSPRRKGKGRGKGVEFLWQPQTLVIAASIEESLRWMRQNSKGRWFGEAVLRAFLIGAPVHPAVVRAYLIEAFVRLEQWATRQLRGPLLEEPKEQRANRAKRWAKASSYRGAWSRLGIPVHIRQAIGEHAAGELVSLRMSSPDDMAQDYDEAAEAFYPKVIGLDYTTAKRFFDPAESVADSHAFFSLRRSRELIETCPDAWLLGSQQLIAGRYHFLHDAVVSPGKEPLSLSDTERQRLQDEVAMMTMLWMLPAEHIMMQALATIAQQAWGSLRPPERDKKT
jgi:hypothetical protein